MMSQSVLVAVGNLTIVIKEEEEEKFENHLMYFAMPWHLDYCKHELKVDICICSSQDQNEVLSVLAFK